MKNFEVKNSTYMRIGEEIYTNPLAFLIVPNNCPSEKTGSMKIFVTWNLIGARFYDPMLKMWLTPDPAGQFNNPYTYGGDQVNFVDPDGRFITFSFNKDGFSLGFNLAPIGVPWGGWYKCRLGW
jgi:hypothetical protein